MTQNKAKPCLREPDDCVQGDRLHIQCRKPGKWKLFQMSGDHKGKRCKVEKNAKAKVLKKYTNIQN